MKRVLSLVLALVMVFGTIMPAFAEETTTKTSGEMLKGYGLIEGTDKGLAEDQPLTRAEMAVILAKLYGKAEEAKTYALPSSFTDVDKDAWFAPWVAYAQAQKWMVGDGKTFRPTENLSVQEINVLMVKVLGYEAEWATANEKAAELKVAVEAADKALVLRGEIFKAMTTTIDQPKKDGTESLGTVLALTGYVAPVPPTPEKLEVAKVMTDNLKTVVVEFNQELNKKTVTTDNFKVTGLTVSKVSLGEDKKTVTMIMSAAIAQSKEIEVEIKKVKDVTDAKTIADYKVKHVVNDVTIPVVESVTVIDAKHVKVMTSEPMDWEEGTFTVLPSVKLDGNSFVGKIVADHAAHTYTIEFNTVKSEGSYKLAIEGLKDFSGLAAVKKEFSFDVAKDETAPVATKAESKSTSVVHVTFDEPLATIGSVTINGKATNETFLADSNDKVIVATIADSADYLTLGATVEVVVKYKGQKDVVGNEVKTETTLTFKVEDDTTLPTATLEVAKANAVTITFSKTMNTGLGKIVVMDKDKKELKTVNITDLAASKWSETDTVLKLVAADLGLDNLNPVDRIIQIKDAKDATVRANLLATVDFSVTVLDTKKPVVTTSYSVSTGTKTATDADGIKDDTITFYFSEAMDEDTIKNLSNFKRNSDVGTFAATTDVSLKSVAADKKSVTFVYPGANTISDAFTVFAVKDLAGNMADTSTNVVVNAAVLATNIPTKVEAKTTTKIEVTYPAAIKTADPASLKIIQSGADYTTATAASIDGAKVTYTLAKALPTDTTGITVTNGTNFTLLTSVFGDKYTGTYAAQNIIDTIKPVVSSMSEGKIDANVTAMNDTMKAVKNFATITMSEHIAVNALTKADYIVKLNDKVLDAADFNLTVVDNTDATTEKYILVEVLSNSKVTADGKYDLSVELIRVSNIEDAATTANKAAVFTKSITDFNYDYTAPAITLTADTTNANVDNNIVITFTDNTAWRAAVTSITVDGGAVTGVWAAGTLTLDPAHADNTELRTPGNKAVVVVATGYVNSTVTQAMAHGALQNLNVATAPVMGARNTTNAVTMGTQPIIQLRDKFNNVCTTLTDNVVISVNGATTPVNATVGGTTTVAAVAGVATFTDLTVTPGSDADITDLDLTFTSGSTTVDVSNLAH